MATSPMTINLYGEDNEIEKTFTRKFVPWKMLKDAIKLQEKLGDLDPKKMKSEDVDEISDFIISVFGNQFTKAEVDEKADMTEVIAVLITIIQIASGGMPKNPLSAAKKSPQK